MNTSNLGPQCLTNTLSLYLNPCGHTCCDSCYERYQTMLKENVSYVEVE